MCVVVVERLLRLPEGWMCSWPGSLVVVGSLGRVAEHGVGGEDVLQRRIGNAVL